jgi:hypothetical protein
MRIALLLAAALFAHPSPAAACGDRPIRPSGMVKDEARLKPLVERMLAARALRDKVQDETWKAVMEDPDFQALKKRYMDADRNSPEGAALRAEYDARMKRDIWDKVSAAAPVLVRHNTFLCGSVTLDDGHSINANSSWSIKNESRPELEELNVSGAAMHYLMEHREATPRLVERLEELLQDRPAVEAPKASRLDPERAARMRSFIAVPSAWN